MITTARFPPGPITKGSLVEKMFQARAAVFGDRLGWEVAIDDGMEIDRYDRFEHPLYVLACEGTEVVGSLRVLPTTGETMLKNEFAGMFDEPVDCQSATAWECTRFCIHPSADNVHRTSRHLVMGICRIALESGIERIVGVYDDRMTKVYRTIGWSPAELTRSNRPGETLFVGIWDVSETALAKMQAKEAKTEAVIRRAV